MSCVRLNTMLKDSITDGPGINLVFVFQGCKARCAGCHNPSTHCMKGGYIVDIDKALEQITDSTTGVTLSGGEPMLQLAAAKEILQKAKKMGFSTTMYTGYTLEAFLQEFPDYAQYLDYVKIGPFIKALRSSKVPYYGSSNQELYKVETDGKLSPWRDNGLL